MNFRNFVLFAALTSVIGCSTVEPGNAGVVVDWDGVQSSPLPEGFHTINVFTDTVVNYPVKVQVYDAPASAMSNDMQVVDTQVTVNYKIAMADTPGMYQTVGMIGDVENVIIRPIVQDTVKKHTAKYTAEELVTSREIVAAAITEEVVSNLASVDITVTEVSLTNFKFAEAFQNAVEAKQVAEQKAQTAMNEVEIERAEAQKAVVRAEAQAEATIELAEAQAEANKLLNNSLTEKIIRYEMVQRWDGVNSKVVSGNGSGLLISVE
jgi:prohibitin 2